MSVLSLSSLSSLSQGNLAVNCKCNRSFLQSIQVSSPGQIPLLLIHLRQVFQLLRDSFSPYESLKYSSSGVLWVYDAAWVEASAHLVVRALGWANVQEALHRISLAFQKSNGGGSHDVCWERGKRNHHGEYFPLFLAIPGTPRPPKECLLPSMCAVILISHLFFHFSLDF